MQRFLDRHDAGRQLARKLSQYANQPDILLLALPRGGVPVAYEAALQIKAPLDVLIVRKLGLPGEEELAIGAIASGGVRILNGELIEALAVAQETIDRITEQETLELQRRERQYRGGRPAPDVRGRTVILIDDGLATGASMLAAVRAVRSQAPGQVIVAVPAASRQALYLLKREAEEAIAVISPEPFDGVGRWYENFSQTTDEEVRFLLEDASRPLLNK